MGHSILLRNMHFHTIERQEACTVASELLVMHARFSCKTGKNFLLRKQRPLVALLYVAMWQFMRSSLLVLY